jgi:hypothetical protein
MRKLGLKLGLSCAALAACATTLVSTTFAWYTSNESVKATGVQGNTSNEDTTLLLISKTGKVGSWGASVNYNFTSDKIVLAPVAYDAEKDDYYTWDASNNKVDTTKATAATDGTTTGGAYLAFSMYFKSGSSQSLNVVSDATITAVANTKEGKLPAKSVLAAGTGSQDDTYTVDMLRATNVVTKVGAAKEVASTSETNADWATGVTPTRTAYSLDSYAKGDTFKDGSSNAHTYYNNVKTLTDKDKATQDTSDDPIDDTIESSEASLSQFASDFVGKKIGETGAGAAANGGLDNCLRVDYVIYVDGWDIACFDAVRSQGITITFGFKGTITTPQNNG